MAHVFVYGTLKRMQRRGNAWPRTPVEVQVAFTLGQLYDLGPYPAMTAGKDIVSGELWSFRPDDITATIKVLDEIEGVSHGMYERVEVNCWLVGASWRRDWSSGGRNWLCSGAAASGRLTASRRGRIARM